MKLIRPILELLGFAALVALTVFLFRPIWFRRFPDFNAANSPDFTRTDIVSIGLTAATVVLAAVAIIISVIAVFGFSFVKDAATQAALQRVDQRFDDWQAIRSEEAVQGNKITPAGADEIAQVAGDPSESKASS